MRKPIAVFYANLLLFQFDSVAEFHTWRRSMVVGNHEIYNGAVVFAPADTRPWLRMDLTPMLLEDVPKELRTPRAVAVMNHVFYKGVLHYQYDPADWTKGRVHTNEEIPAFCWIFNDEQPGWFYMENPRFSTHVPTEHVPAELRALALLLT